MYATIDCNGECGNCIALVCDGEVVKGPPFHPRCRCVLTQTMIDNAMYEESNLQDSVANNKNCLPDDVKWLKNALFKLGFYKPNIRAGEKADNLNQYPNQNLFDAVNEFQNKYKLDEHNEVKPGNQTEVKIKEELEKQIKMEKNMKTNDNNFEQAYNQLKKREGGYTTGKNQKKDEPTNMGIKQSTLDRYSAKYPNKNFLRDVKNLKEYQAKEIYKDEYWDNTRIPQIENDRIRNAVFDMNVMGGAGKVVQRAINYFSDANLKVDGVIGKETIKAINAIPDTKIEEFISVIKSERINYLQDTKNWETAKNGWIKRTNTY